jgi:hypothetical protein
MNKEIEDFYDCLKDLYSDIVRTRTKTISTQEFKDRAISIYETWKIKVKPLLANLEIDYNVLNGLDGLFGVTYSEATSRVGDVSHLKDTLGELHETFLNKIITPLNSGQTAEPTRSVMEYASFLGLDTNWSVAVCALQLQEVAVTLVAEKLKTDLSKTSVERILNTKIESKNFSFNHQYEAFGKEVKRLFDIDMPILVPQLRRMRVNVLHEGYNPEPEEKDSLVSFTAGLLRKLKDIFDKV